MATTYADYEREKAKLVRAGLSPAEYQKALAKLAKRMKL